MTVISIASNQKKSALGCILCKLNSRFIFVFHNPVKYQATTWEINRTGVYPLNQTQTLKTRNQLEAKMADVFKEEIQELSAEFRQILVDDLVTAFENRFTVLSRPQIGRRF
jgi:hypothetical protein